MKTKWTKIDAAAAEALTQATVSPGFVYPLDLSGLPSNLQAMRGAESYFVSAYTSGVPAGPGTIATAEFAVVRRDGTQPKGYNYVIATSSGGDVYFTGPFRIFDGHHMRTTDAVGIARLFGHSPWHK